MIKVIGFMIIGGAVAELPLIEELNYDFAHLNKLEEIVITEGPRGNDQVCIGKTNVAVRSAWYADKVGEQFIGFCCEEKFFDIFCSEQCSCPVNAGPTCYRGGRRVGSCTGTGSILGENPFEGKVGRCLIENDPSFGNFTVDIDAQAFCQASGKTHFYPKYKRKNENPSKIGKFDLIIDQDRNKSSTGLTMTHAAIIPKTTKIVLWTRAQKPDVPNDEGISETFSTVFDYVTGKYEATKIVDNPFCSGQMVLSDGRILATGGEATDADWGTHWAPYVTEGRYSIRYFHPKNQTWHTLENQKMRKPRWYPTQLETNDGRVIITGGLETMAGPINPLVEIFDTKTDTILNTLESTNFTQVVGSANLYPYMSILPNEKDQNTFFQFVCSYGEIQRLKEDNTIETVRTLPKLPNQICSHFSGTGTGKLLALSPENNYQAEFITFGGTNLDLGYSRGCLSDNPGLSTSYRINLSNEHSEWEIEDMPFPRVGGTAIVLPTGDVVILNGGAQGFGNHMQKRAVLTAILYQPSKPVNQRYQILDTSTIPRTYHSNAMLLPDGNIIVGGTDQGESYSDENGPWCGSSYQYELRAESFKPPYHFYENRATILTKDDNDLSASFGSTFEIQFNPNVNVTGASLVFPSATTHSNDMSGRVVFLKTSNLDIQSGKITVQFPTYESQATTKGNHMIFLLTHKNTAASTNSIWIKLTN